MSDRGGAHFLDDCWPGDFCADTEPGALINRRVEPAVGVGEVDQAAANRGTFPGGIRGRCFRRRFRHRADDLEPQVDNLDRPSGDVVTVDLGMRGAKAASERRVDHAACPSYVETIQGDWDLEILALV